MPEFLPWEEYSQINDQYFNRISLTPDRVRKEAEDSRFTSPVCDKCGKSVEPENNVALFIWTVDAQVTGNPEEATLRSMYYPNRHLFPTDDGCEGSPSRVEHITGEPDIRNDSSHGVVSICVEGFEFFQEALKIE